MCPKHALNCKTMTYLFHPCKQRVQGLWALHLHRSLLESGTRMVCNTNSNLCLESSVLRNSGFSGFLELQVRMNCLVHDNKRCIGFLARFDQCLVRAMEK